jgi:protein-S-isoprenylcysteine O-methyltransferase Ste14
VGVVWLAWLVLAGGVGSGYARTRPEDRVDDRGTRAWADLCMVAAMVGSIAVALALPVASIPGDPWLTIGLGSAVVALGIALRLWAARTLGWFFTQSVALRPDHRVVATGPYRFVRHPAYSALLVSMIGLGLTLGNALSVAVMIVGFFAAHIPRIRVEERVLEEGLGDEYRRFERTRKRLIPEVW